MLRISAKLPWNKSAGRPPARDGRRASVWTAAPTPAGLLLTWTVGGVTVRPAADTLPRTGADGHAMLFAHLHAAAADRLVIGETPLVTAAETGFVISTPALYAGNRLTQAEGTTGARADPEILSVCRGIREWLPFVLDHRPPDEIPVEVALRAHGDFATSEFAIGALVTPQILQGRQWREVGPFIEYTDGMVELMPQEAYELLKEVRSPWPRAPLDRLRHWAHLKPLAETAGASMDSYLQGEDAIVVDRIQPRPVRYGAGRLDLRPAISVGAADDDDSPFADATNRFGDPQQLYNLEERETPTVTPEAASTHSREDAGPARRRRRYVLSPEAKDALGVLKAHPTISGADAARSLTDPEALFSGPGFDLEGYSDRVIGVGVYVYRALPYLGRPGEKRDWFAWTGEGSDLPPFGMVLQPPPREGQREDGEDEADDGTEGETGALSLPLSDLASRAELAARLAAAEDEDEPLVEVAEGRFVPVFQARRLLDQAEELAQAQTPEQRRKLVFQILENIERREYQADQFSQVSRQTPLLPPPPDLRAGCPLLEHQRSGYSWLSAQGAEGGPRAALLADEMGLGKTLQVLCTLAERRRRSGPRPVLVVTPVSLLENWQREADHFFPGVFRDRIVLENRPLTTAKEMARAHLALSSFETLRGAVQFEAGKVDWDVLILDEAQRIKNPTTQTSIAVKGLKAQFRIAMTATPVENSLAELWNIIDFLLPDYLLSLREFHREYILAWKNSGESGRDEIAEKLVGKLQPLLLRRLKQDVLDLPAKVEKPVHLPMSRIQGQLYAEILRQTRAQEIHPLVALRKLLDVCAHPALLDPALAAGAPAAVCPKLEYTLQELEHIRQVREKALIFTGSRTMQTVLQSAFAQRFGAVPETINGSTAPPQRQALLDRFARQDGFAVLLLSPRAAGLGLNITAATHVFHYTREWNPAVEAQATDRAHRIGQTQSVTVHYPITSGGGGAQSVEQTLDTLLREKAGLARSIVRPTAEQEIRPEDVLAHALR